MATAASIIADSASFAAAETKSASVKGDHTPAVCVALESLDGSADDTLTVEIVGNAGTYTADERTLSSTGSYIVDVPQSKEVRLTSANGTTLSAEVRNNPS